MWEWNDYANLSDDELKHYGIPGMKWGIHRARSLLNYNSQDKLKNISKHTKARELLDKHYSKTKNKIFKLDNKLNKAQAKSDKIEQKYAMKEAKLRAKSNKLERKANGFMAKMFGDPKSNSKKIGKAYKLTLKADKIQAKRAKAKAKVDKILSKKNQFERGLKDINKMRDPIINKSKNIDSYVDKYFNMSYSKQQKELDKYNADDIEGILRNKYK